MTWTETKAVLARLGYYNFESYEHYREWFNDQDDYHQKRIKNALCKHT